MVEEISIKNINPVLNLGIEDVRNEWLLSATPVKLTTNIHQGNLIFRLQCLVNVSFIKPLKRGLIKKN